MSTVSQLGSNSNAWTYDLESFADFFSASFKNLVSGRRKVFLIHKERNDFAALIRFIHSDEVEYLISFNGIHYDDKMLGYMAEHCRVLGRYSSDELTDILCRATQYIINNDKSFRPKHTSWYKRVDLYSLLGCRRTGMGLKACAIAMQRPDIQDLPIEPGHPVPLDKRDFVLEYNDIDVDVTEALFLLEEKEIKLREFMGKKYDMNLYNADRTYLGKLIFMDKFNSKVPEEFQVRFDNLRQWRTYRDYVDLKDVIDDRWEFETPLFQDIHKYLMSTRIDIVDGKYRWWAESKQKYTEFQHKVDLGDLVVSIGCGGIHSNESRVEINPSESEFLIENDFSSFYPNLIAAMRAVPEHFLPVADAFIETELEMITDRMFFKHHPNPTEETESDADALKIAINAQFGLMGSEYFAFYDPAALLKVTINGQLGLLKGVEMAMQRGLTVVSCNTDGFVVYGDKSLEPTNVELVTELEEIVGCKCDISPFKRMINKDVNNYIWIKPNGKAKQKGVFLPLKERRLDQSVNHPIVMDALNKYFLEDVPIETTINECTDIMAFCMSQKLGIEKSSNLQYSLWTVDSDENPLEKQQKTTRYYCATEGPMLKRVGLHKTAFIIKDQSVQIFNRYVNKPFEEYKVDKNYYIKLATKIVANYKKLELCSERKEVPKRSQTIQAQGQARVQPQKRISAEVSSQRM